MEKYRLVKGNKLMLLMKLLYSIYKNFRCWILNVFNERCLFNCIFYEKNVVLNVVGMKMGSIVKYLIFILFINWWVWKFK